MLFRLFTVLAVIALAVSTWILSSPAHRPAATAHATQDDLPGYYLKGAVLIDYDAQGHVAMHMDAERIDQIDHGVEVRLTQVRFDYLAPGGQRWQMLGDTARVQPGGKIIDVAGHVRLQGDASARGAAALVRSDTMTYDVDNATASTQSDVRLDYGAQTLTARGLVANLKERTMRLESKVNGRFKP